MYTYTHIKIKVAYVSRLTSIVSCKADEDINAICSRNVVTPEVIKSDNVKSGVPGMSTPVIAFIWAQ